LGKFEYKGDDLMTQQKWYYKSLIRGHRARNSIQREFIASEKVGTPISALIREGSQNTGDARSKTLDSNIPVKIRIYLSGKEMALNAKNAARWGAGLWDHISASGSGLRHPPTPDSTCSFIVFEDFGTTGLTGDTENEDDDEKPFYCFFRAENSSSKDVGSDGSWGVGKTAFPRMSKANVFFALSKREDDGRSVLMGSQTLRIRDVNGVKYTPDSWFGEPEHGVEEGGLIQPIEDEAVLRDFSNDFHLSRTDECGTSIVVPWCDDSLTRRDVAEAVIESNFFPIIAGDLVVAIDSWSESDSLTIDSDTIEDVLIDLNLENQNDLLARVQLAKWACTDGKVKRVVANHDAGSHSVKWEQYSLSDTDRDSLRIQYDRGEPISIRVPVPMKRIDQDSPRTSHLDVFLQQMDNNSTVKPICIRGNVVVPDKLRKVAGGVAIVKAYNDQFGKLLRAAEDPGHTGWSIETENFAEFKETYKYPKAFLTLARQAAFRAWRILQDLDADEDFELLSDVFSIPKETDEPDSPSGGGGKRRKSKKPPALSIKRAPKMVSITRTVGGFSITPAASDVPTPSRIRIKAAYDVRKKDPFDQWAVEDFEFGKKPIKIEAQDGLDLVLIEGNRIIAEVKNKAFRLSVKGFDTERGDLAIEARPEGRLDD
jgi:hypothetical protein